MNGTKGSRLQKTLKKIASSAGSRTSQVFRGSARRTESSGENEIQSNRRHRDSRQRRHRENVQNELVSQ